MGYVVDRRYVPGHFVGHGQFQHYERPHWASASGAWVRPPAHANNAGFSQVHSPGYRGGFVQMPTPARNAFLSNVLRHTALPPSRMDLPQAPTGLEFNPASATDPTQPPILPGGMDVTSLARLLVLSALRGGGQGPMSGFIE